MNCDETSFEVSLFSYKVSLGCKRHRGIDDDW